MKNVRWIQGDSSCESPLFRRDIYLSKKPDEARLEICGLGYFQAFINGIRIGNEEFTPAVTGYSSVLGCETLYPVWEERTFYRTGYLVYDVTKYLKQGENVLGIWLGNGWYHQNKRKAEGKIIFGTPMLRYELTVMGEGMEPLYVESDSKTLWKTSEIVENNLFYGEKHDLRLRRDNWCRKEESLEDWKKSFPVHAPETELIEQTCPPDRIIRSIQPKLVSTSDKGKIYDCGENITGWVTVICNGESGSCVRVRHSEELSSDGKQLDFESGGGKEQIQMDSYICGKLSEEVHPRFCWHGFRYFEIDGPGEVKDVSVIHTDIQVTSGFQCSNSVLNWLYTSYVRTQLGNIHGCVPSDCPHRERLGYTGDGQITAEAAMLSLDTREMYKKWMEDIWDSQGADTGHIPHTAPFLGGGGGPGGWGGAVYVIPMTYYEVYGDSSLLEKGYMAIMRWLDYMYQHSEKGIVISEEEGGWCLGEWCTPPGMQHPSIPPEFVNTYYFIKGLKAAQKTEKLLKKSETKKLELYLKEAESEFVKRFFNIKTESFCEGKNGADAFAIDLGLGSKKTVANMLQKYKDAETLDTGIFGTPILMETLMKNGGAETAIRLLTGKQKYSFGHMMEQNATTLWETWDGSGSHNHPMFGGVVRLLFTEILGIRRKEDGAGFSSYEIKPRDVKRIDWAEGWITTPSGCIKVRWERDKEGDIRIIQDN